MHWDRPQLLLLLILLPLCWRWIRLARRPWLTVLRVVLLLVMGIAMAGPQWLRSTPGVDLFVVVDQSTSVGGLGVQQSQEYIGLLQRSMGQDDRMAIIRFAGPQVSITRSLDGMTHLPCYEGGLSSPLASALELAAACRSPYRNTRAVILSDGLFTGADPRAAKTLSRLSEFPVHYRPIGSLRATDAAVMDMVLPEQITPGAGFLIRFSIHSNTDNLPVSYKLKSGKRILLASQATLRQGANWFVARDRAPREGIVEYELTITSPQDTLPGNNIGRSLLSVQSPPRILLVTADGKGGVIQQWCTQAGINLQVLAAEAIPHSAAELSAYKLIILENIPLKLLTSRGTKSLTQLVESGVTSLLVTGGKNSFGNGGYYKSPVEPLLPITMELKNEQRRGTMALAIVLDRSGSMSAPASGSGGRTKMDLANLASAQSIALLSGMDQVSVLAVDTEPHVIVPLAQADDTAALQSRVRKIQSLGGGIYVHDGLQAAYDQLKKSSLPSRHILLFSDADDSEQQKGCLKLAKELKQQDIGLSVIALGNERGADAPFLKRLAEAMDTEAWFTQRAKELPQLFNQEIIRVSRRGFISEPTATTLLPSIIGFDISASKPGPAIGGYNLSSLRDGATGLILSADEYLAPIAAIWKKGKSSVGVITAELDGPHSGKLLDWSSTGKLVVGMVRRLSGEVNLANVKSYSHRRRGQARVRFEFSEARAKQLQSRTLSANLIFPDAETVQSFPLTWVSATEAEVLAELPQEGHYIATMDLGDEGVVKAPPISQPYSPEFLPAFSIRGGEVLEEIASATGGKQVGVLTELFEPPEHPVRQYQAVTPWLIGLAIAMLLTEMGFRRLSRRR